MSLILPNTPLATATELAALTQKVAANAAIAAAAAAANATSIQALATELGLDEAQIAKLTAAIALTPTPTPTPTPGPAMRPSYNTGTGFFVLGKTLYDAAGYEFRIRGVNKAHYDSTQYDIINNMKANAVRWNLYDAVNTMSAQVAAASAWIARKIVPIPGNWTGTCQDSATYLTSIVDLWVAQAASWTTVDLQRYAIINIANEWGPVNSVVWRDSYISAIGRMRAAGYKQTLMIDSGGCGQDAANLLQYAQAVFDSDPQKNVIFDLHIYGYFYRVTKSWQQQQDYDAVLPQLSQLNVPIVIGEFGPGRNIGPSPTPITPLEIMTSAEGYKWGWMAWAADDNDQANSMSDDYWFAMLYNNFAYASSADLTTFGKVVVDDVTYGLKALAVKAMVFT